MPVGLFPRADRKAPQQPDAYEELLVGRAEAPQPLLPPLSPPIGERLQALRDQLAAQEQRQQQQQGAGSRQWNATRAQIKQLEALVTLSQETLEEALRDATSALTPEPSASGAALSAPPSAVAAPSATGGRVESLVDQLSSGVLELKAQQAIRSKESSHASAAGQDGESPNRASPTPSNASTSLAQDMLSSVHHSASALESAEQAEHDTFSESKRKGAKMEAVLKVDGNEEAGGASAAGRGTGGKADGDLSISLPHPADGRMPGDAASLPASGAAAFSPSTGAAKGAEGSKVGEVLQPSRLIDVDNNEYVLSQSSDIAKMYEDEKLLKDLMVMLLTCFAIAFFLSYFRLPAFLGFILAGVVLRSGGITRIGIQTESIARGFGAIFLMFTLGLEFNATRLRQVFKVSVLGSTALLVGSILAVQGVCAALHASAEDALVIGISLFLSSTAVIVTFLAGEETESVYGKPMVGIVVCQDVLFGLFLAILPALDRPADDMVLYGFSVVASLLMFLGLALLIGYYPLAWVLHHAHQRSRELFLLGIISFCFGLVLLSGWLRLPLELACFVAGVVLNLTSPHDMHAGMRMVESVRDFFLPLFFASIGLHVFPSFLWQQLRLLLLLAVAAIAFKVALAYAVMRHLFRYSARHALIIGVGLAQISEYVFVFAARAKARDLISRETFYLLLGTTSLSLVLSPMLWYALQYLHVKPTHHPVGKLHAESGVGMEEGMGDHGTRAFGAVGMPWSPSGETRLLAPDGKLYSP